MKRFHLPATLRVCATICLFCFPAFADNTVTPGALSFLSVVGGGSPPMQALTVSPFSTTGTWTVATDGAPWISVEPSGGTGNGTIVVSVAVGSLAAGAYSSVINVAFAGDPRSYAQAVSFNVAPSQVTFSANFGGNNPAAQTLLLSIASGGTLQVNWNVSVSTDGGGNWLVVSPNSGSNNPGTTGSISVSAIIGTLPVGTYSGTITLSGGAYFVGGTNTDSAIPVQLTVVAPVPVLSSCSVGSFALCNGTVTIGASSQTMTVGGSGFSPDSEVLWNGVALSTTYHSASSLSAVVPGSYLTSAGVFPITVLNPDAGGATSNAINFLVNNPAANITGLSSTSALLGSSGFTLTVTGNGFMNGATVQWNGSNRNTTFVSSSALTATISTSDLATAGNYPISAANPSPSLSSNTINFAVSSPAPALTGLSPSSGTTRQTVLLSVSGNNFVNGASIVFNGTYYPATFLDGSNLAASIAMPAAGATVSVDVANPSPSLGASNSLTFTINNPAPVLTALSTVNAPAGSASFVLDLSGSGFVTTSQVAINRVNRTTASGGSGSLGVLLTTADLATPGTLAITVTNPTPGGGTSNTLTFTVTGANPSPSISLLSPSTVAAGAAGFTLNVYGSNFVPASVVQWGGSARPTTFGSAQQLSAIINASDVATSGPIAVTVNNPTPSGGTSSPITFTVGSSSQGSLAAQSVNGSPGAPVSIPLVLNLNNGATVGALSFGVLVTPTSNAPPIAANMAFQSDAALPVPSGSPPTVTATNTNEGVFYGSFTSSLTGQVSVGVVQVAIPANAAVGQTYTVHVTEADAAQGSAAVPLAAGADATVTLVLGYLVGDSFPHAADTVGSFGDGALNTLDLIDVLRAVTNISTPATCSDRFDDMDASPVDTATQRGGDGVLNTLDLIETLRRVTALDTSRPQRTPRGLTCSQNEAESRRPPEAAGITEGTIEVEGNAIYLAARHDLNLKGLAVSFRLQEGQQANFTPGEISASIVDVGQPGKIAMAYLNGITLAGGKRLLLGSVDGVDRGALLGVSANDRSGEEVRITGGAVRVR